MGVAACDFDGDGNDDWFRTNFSDERSTLYANRANGTFDDAKVRYALGANPRFAGWGCAFLDAACDGWRDVLLVNRDVFPEAENLADSEPSCRERPALYHNQGGVRFESISLTPGPGVLARRPAGDLAGGRHR